MDAEGRVVIARGPLTDGIDAQFISRASDHDAIVDMRWSDDDVYRAYVTLVFRAPDGRVLEAVTGSGRHMAYSYRAGAAQPYELIETTPSGRITHVSFDVGSDGQLMRAVDDTGPRANVLWDARAHALEPVLSDYDTIAATVAAPIADAIVRRIAQQAADWDGDVIAVSVLNSNYAAPPIAVVRPRLVRRLRHDAESEEELLDLLHDAAHDPDCYDSEALDLLDELDPSTLRALRHFRQRVRARHPPRGDLSARKSAALAIYLEVVQRVNRQDLPGGPIIAWLDGDSLASSDLGPSRSTLPAELRGDVVWTLTAATAGLAAMTRLRDRLGC